MPRSTGIGRTGKKHKRQREANDDKPEQEGAADEKDADEKVEERAAPRSPSPSSPARAGVEEVVSAWLDDLLLEVYQNVHRRLRTCLRKEAAAAIA